VSLGAFELAIDHIRTRPLRFFYELENGLETKTPNLGAAHNHVTGLGVDG